MPNTILIQVNVKSLHAPCRHMGGGGVVEVEPHSFLTLAVDGGEWSSSCSSHFAPAETAPSFKKYFKHLYRGC